MEIPQELLTKSDHELNEIIANKEYLILPNQKLDRVLAFIPNKVLVTQRTTYKGADLNMKFHEKSLRFLTHDFMKQLKSKSIIQSLSKLNTTSVIKYVKSIFLKHFPEEYIDIQNEYDDEFDIIIYYPEVTLTNSAELSHTMKDIYVKYHFYKDFDWVLSNLLMTRTTYTKREADLRYTFSHLNLSSCGKYGSAFCYGRSTLIKNVRENLFTDIFQLETFIILFNEYLLWESIEGTPYKLISNLQQNSNSFRKARLENEEEFISEGYLYVINNLTELDFDYKEHNNVPYPVLSSNSKDIIALLLEQKFPDQLYYKVDNRSIIEPNNETTTHYLNGTDSAVKFKGETKKIKILPDQVDVSAYPKAIHQDILGGVIVKLQELFNQYIIDTKIKEQLC